MFVTLAVLFEVAFSAAATRLAAAAAALAAVDGSREEGVETETETEEVVELVVERGESGTEVEADERPEGTDRDPTGVDRGTVDDDALVTVRRFKVGVAADDSTPEGTMDLRDECEVVEVVAEVVVGCSK